ncbi:MAG: hypothetical protein ACYDBH_00885 [Acidobacteriaceae bacterium]
MTQNPYLPDGCSDADVDRAMGAMTPDQEKLAEEVESCWVDASAAIARFRAAVQDASAALDHLFDAQSKIIGALLKIRNRAPNRLYRRLTDFAGEVSNLDISLADWLTQIEQFPECQDMIDREIEE